MNTCCEHNTKGCNWAVGSNMPGYMPDDHAEHYGNWLDARQAFISAIKEAAQGDDVEDQSDAVNRAVDEAVRYLRRNGPAREASVHIGRYVYWLTRM